MKKLTFVVFVVIVAALCPAPIKELPPKGYEAPPMSMSDSALNQQQSSQQKIREVGRVEQVTDKVQADGSSSSSEARDVLSSSEVKEAKDVLVTASRSIKDKEGANPWFYVWALVIASLGFGAITAVRQWANKNISDVTTQGKRITW